MILVDTSTWIDHLRSRDLQLINLLEQGQVSIQPMIIDELAYGSLQIQRQLLDF